MITNSYQNKTNNIHLRVTTTGYNWSDISTETGSWSIYRTKPLPEVKQLIFREESKTTVVLWKDGTKTIVKSAENEDFIPEVGFAEALAKKIYGSRSAFLRVVENAYYQPVKKEKVESSKSLTKSR